METLKILWYNWKDIMHPEAGGAEIYTHEIAKRLVAYGNEVTLFTSTFPGCMKTEYLDGVRIIRAGGRYTVYRYAKKFYRERFSIEKYDVVIDEVNTRPFLTPKYVDGGEKIIALIHQLAREYWFYETFFPINLIGYYILEEYWLRNYIDRPTITVSNSTMDDLKRLGFKNIYIVYNGLNVEPVDRVPEKSDNPTIIYVGRMKRVKKPQDVIEAFKIVKEKIRDVELWMVGDGYLRRKLMDKAKDVKFYGYLDKKAKDELVRKAWILVAPGVREGWGQVVTDANALGTPVVGYNVPGLRDSIKHGYNGLLIEKDNINALAEGIITLIEDNDLRKRLSINAIKWAKKFNWDKSAKEFERALKSDEYRK